MSDGKDYAAMAVKIWGAMSDNEKTGVRFGMFPARLLRLAEVLNGFTDQRLLCLALMDQAKTNGGMRA